MRLPDFLGIGAQRSGSTWLHEQLARHPGIYVPPSRKEVGFFGGERFERGVGWYGTYFEGAREDQVVGETTPWYFESERVAEQIQALLPECRFLLVLRNPVDRVFSQFTRGFRDRAEIRTFEQFLVEQPNSINKSRYATQLKRYLNYFELDQFLILVSDEMWTEPGTAFRRVALFLGVDPSGFAIDEGAGRNASYQVRYPQLYRRLRLVGRRMRARELDWIVEGAKRIGVPRLFRSRGDALPKLQPEARERLWGLLEDDVLELESITGMDLSIWRPV